jgi:hypothetical protein
VRLSEQEYADLLQRSGKAPPEKKQPKYRNNRNWSDGILWDSDKEMNYYHELKLLQRPGVITGFCRQCQFVLCEGTDKDNRAVTYLADFVIFYPDGTYKITDIKGIETEIFVQKKKQFKERYPRLELKIE